MKASVKPVFSKRGRLILPQNGPKADVQLKALSLVVATAYIRNGEKHYKVFENGAESEIRTWMLNHVQLCYQHQGD
jgi:hypothetical protein